MRDEEIDEERDEKRQKKEEREVKKEEIEVKKEAREERRKKRERKRRRKERKHTHLICRRPRGSPQPLQGSRSAGKPHPIVRGSTGRRRGERRRRERGGEGEK